MRQPFWFILLLVDMALHRRSGGANLRLLLLSCWGGGFAVFGQLVRWSGVLRLWSSDWEQKWFVFRMAVKNLVPGKNVSRYVSFYGLPCTVYAKL